MNLGNKLQEKRKEKKMSQEEVATRLGVTRQTISKWELNETTPDIKQAKLLSELYGVSLDELLDNDIKEVLTEKVSNTERLAGLILKILKFIGIFIVVSLVLSIIGIFMFTYVRTAG